MDTGSGDEEAEEGEEESSSEPEDFEDMRKAASAKVRNAEIALNAHAQEVGGETLKLWCEFGRASDASWGITDMQTKQLMHKVDTL